MLFIKFLGALIIVSSGTMCGIYAAGGLKRRVEFLEQYIIFLTQAKTMISYSAVSVSEIFSEVSSVPLVRPFLDICLDGLSGGMSLKSSWHDAVNSMYEQKLFSASDKALMYSFGETFGIGGINEEMTKTELHIALMNERLDEAKAELASKNKLYRILGMFGGIMVALIIL